ncbi:hypothetical protein OIU78_026109 [Salix suchowensis]|nr:hypothetical protein OIU78_026109 [Salix suchowensis]
MNAQQRHLIISRSLIVFVFFSKIGRNDPEVSENEVNTPSSDIPLAQAASKMVSNPSNNEDAEEIESSGPLKSFKNHARRKILGVDAIPCKDDNTEQQNFFVGEDESMIKGHLSSISFSSRFSMTDESLNDDRSSVSSSHSSASGDLDMKQYSPLIDSSNPLAVEREFITDRSREEDSQDPFYKKYTERMRWFDVLNHERTSEISAFLSFTFL